MKGKNEDFQFLEKLRDGIRNKLANGLQREVKQLECVKFTLKRFWRCCTKSPFELVQFTLNRCIAQNPDLIEMPSSLLSQNIKKWKKNVRGF